MGIRLTRNRVWTFSKHGRFAIDAAAQAQNSQTFWPQSRKDRSPQQPLCTLPAILVYTYICIWIYSSQIHHLPCHSLSNPQNPSHHFYHQKKSWWGSSCTVFQTFTCIWATQFAQLMASTWRLRHQRSHTHCNQVASKSAELKRLNHPENLQQAKPPRQKSGKCHMSSSCASIYHPSSTLISNKSQRPLE